MESMQKNEKPHLLIVDDEENVREFLVYEIQKIGYEATAAASAKEALSLFDRERVDLVLADIVMPEMDGFHLMQALKQKDPLMEVILMTGYGTLNTAVEAMRKGACDYVVKPFQMQEMILRIQRGLERVAIKRKLVFLEEKIAQLEKTSPASKNTEDVKLEKEKLAAISRLVSGIAHEINNPLTAVIGYSQLLMDTGGEDLQKQLPVIRDQAFRCGKIIQDLLVFARKKKPQMTSFNLQDLLADVLREFSRLFQERHIQVKQDYSRNISPVLQGDPLQLRRVFNNLISNAADALENKKGERKITIGMQEAAGGMEISIKDNGPGISTAHLGKVFDPFFTTKEVGKGTGLGLSLCYGFIMEHGGAIKVASEEGHGAVFTVFLPHPSEESKINVPVVRLATSRPKGKKCILIVEDEAVVAEFMQQILEEKYVVEVVGNGKAGLDAIQKKDFDVVVCDYHIPIMNGIQLFEQVRQERPGMAEKFVFVTASIHLAEDQGEEYFSKNNIAYLQKPFTPSGLMQAVEKKAA